MFYILGIVLGLLNLIDFGAFGLGEIFFIIFLFILSINKRNSNKRHIIYLKNNFNMNLINVFLFIIFLSGYILWSNISMNLVVKAVIKWITIFVEMIFIYKSLVNNNKTINLLITFLIFSKLAEYHTFNSIYALHYFFVIPIFNLLYIKNGSDKYKFLLYAICLIYFLIGKSRSGLVLLIAYIACEWTNYVYLNIKSKKINNIIKSLFIVIMFVIGAILSFNYIGSNISESTESNNERRALLEVVIEEFKDSPLIGVGPINFNNYAQNTLGYKLRNNQLTPHNLYLEILAENGLIGFLLFINILFIMFKVLKNKKIELSIKFSALYILVYYMFSTFTGTNRIVFTVLYTVVAYEYYKKIKEEHYE